MLIAILNDTHAGVRNGSDIFLDYSEKFYHAVFFPMCDMLGIKQVLHLGDYLDHRKYVSFKVLNRMRKMFLNELVNRGMKMDIIPGNHDVSYKTTNSLCGLKEVLGYFTGNVQIYMRPTTVMYDSLAVGLLPWITTDNKEESIKFIDECPAPILVGHLELSGFPMLKGQPLIDHGPENNPMGLARYEMVLSGHYHTASNKGNIHYLGTQYEQSWADYDDPKGFHILDTEKRTLTFIRNPHSLFAKLVYDDRPESPADSFELLRKQIVTNKFVKVIVLAKSDAKKYDRFLDAVNKQSPHDVKVLEAFENFTLTNDDQTEVAVTIENTPHLISSFIDGLDTDMNRQRLKMLANELYIEAQSQGQII